MCHHRSVCRTPSRQVRSAEPEKQSSSQGAQKDHRGREQRIGEDRLEIGRPVGRFNASKLSNILVLAVEELDYGHAGDVLVEVAVEPGQPHSNPTVDPAHRPLEEVGDDSDYRQHRQAEQRQLPVDKAA